MDTDITLQLREKFLKTDAIILEAGTYEKTDREYFKVFPSRLWKNRFSAILVSFLSCIEVSVV